MPSQVEGKWLLVASQPVAKLVSARRIAGLQDQGCRFRRSGWKGPAEERQDGGKAFKPSHFVSGTRQIGIEPLPSSGRGNKAIAGRGHA